jgi:hypothetical protein
MIMDSCQDMQCGVYTGVFDFHPDFSVAGLTLRTGDSTLSFFYNYMEII